MIELAVAIPIIRTDFIKRYLETLYRYTPPVFRVFICDQSINGMDQDLIRRYVHWYTKPYHNLGFAKSANELMWTAYRQGYPYIAVVNDDVEYINSAWWQGIKDEFADKKEAIAVNPECPRVPLWGYGRNHDEYADILPYKETYTQEDYNYLLAGNFQEMKQRYPDLPQSFPLEKRGVIDGIAMWHPVFKREALEKVGYLDERFLYGGGEDYDLNCRAYRLKYRMISSMKSWVWHWWGQSKDAIAELPPELFDRPSWNNLDELWPPDWNFGQGCDPWGMATDPVTQQKQALKRVPEVHIDPL